MNRKPSSQTEPGDHRTIQGTGKSETKSGEYRPCQVACPKPNSPSRPSPQRGKKKQKTHLKCIVLIMVYQFLVWHQLLPSMI